VAASSNEGVKS